MSATTDDALLLEGPVALAARVRGREVSPRELVELSLRRMEALDPRLNAFRHVRAEQALAEADALTDPDGPLAGVPFAVKDDIPLAGEPMTHGSRTHPPIPQQDGEMVRRLRAAGAIPVGITNVPELMIFPWTASEANGITRNPYDLERTPGGSSGGSAAAVAAGLVGFATGSDGGGSIRIPAACCGLVGMKPSRGRVSTLPYRECWVALSTFGALARTVPDSAALLDIAHGAAGGERDALPPPEESFAAAAAREPGRLRIAVSRKMPPGLIAKLSGDQRGAFERARDRLAELGHEVIERDPDYGLSSFEFAQRWARGIRDDAAQHPDHSLLERSTRQMVAAGRLVSDRRRERLMGEASANAERIRRLWNEVDVLLTPGLATTAIAAEGAFRKSAVTAFNLAGRFTPWTALFNLTGQPAITLPAGLGSDGLPLSVQLAGRIGEEGTLYSLAAQLEAAPPFGALRPALAA